MGRSTSESMIIGWNGNSPVFAELIGKVKPDVIVEVGSWHGQSTITMARASNAKIYAIDTWLGALEFYTNPAPERDLELKNGYPQVYHHFIENLKKSGVQERVEAIPLDSRNGLRLLAHRKIQADLIYIDASHEYEDVKTDIALAFPLLSERGVMFGDDYTNKDFTGVKRAIDEFCTPIIKYNNFWVYDRNSNPDN